jgi:hypothetical protein
MDDGSNPLSQTTRAAPPLEGRRDAGLEQRLTYLAGEQARLKGGVPLRRFLRGAMSAYRHFLLTADAPPPACAGLPLACPEGGGLRP